VGSYPAVKAKGFKSMLDPYREALEVAVSDQINAGIDIISTGQIRGDMVSTILSRLPGISGQEVKGLIKPASGPITISDTKYALSKHGKVKAMFAGPSTLAHALKIKTPMYRNRDEIIPDIAISLIREAEFLQETGISILQIDEPILSTGIANMNAAYESISSIAGALRVPVCLHVCGNVGAVFDDIMKMPVDIIDLEFANNPDNIETISKNEIRNKIIGYGVVDSADEAIDPVGTIVSRIRKAVDLLGPENIIIDPDCGLRMHRREVAFGKLKNMAEAAENVRLEL
jgi:5-methyltetrahydropteroyltriglutamate--homocysteine methyltransferase